MVSVSRNLKFLTIQKLNNRTLNTIMESIDEILTTYNKNKFYIVEMLMDMEFEPLHEELKKRNIELNTTSADEHVPEIERMIQTIKERMRAYINRMPYKKYQL